MNYSDINITYLIIVHVIFNQIHEKICKDMHTRLLVH